MLAFENFKPSLACTGTVVNTFPYNESFESGLGNWTQNTGDDGNWTRDQNGTPSGGTGPVYASQGNSYIYTEASSGGLGSNASTILTSPCIDLTGTSEAYFSLDYHMYGNNTGSLRVEVSTNAGASWNSLFFISGQQQTASTSPYRKEIIDLSAYTGNTINLRINGTTGNGFRSDIAIDNIIITDEPQYCGAMGIYGNSTIRRVTFNTIDNNSPTEPIGYSDFSNISTTVNQGDTHNLSVQINTTGNFTFGVNAWIDWNQDNIFDTATEQYNLGTRANTTNGATSNSPLSITIPNTAALGPTRMRVISRFNAFPNPCDQDNNFFGEVEDYTINVNSGTSQAEINVSGLSINITDGDTTPSLADNTNFGSIGVGSPVSNTFTISNTGTLPLNLTGVSPYVTISGSPYFTLTTIPSNSIAPAGTTTFQITFTPSIIGTHTANIEIFNNDLDENPYNFTIRGVGVGAQPEIVVEGAGNIINDGDTTPIINDNTHFGTTSTNLLNVNDFTISNIGTGVLSLTGASPYITISGADATQFSMITIPTNTIAAGGNTSFSIGYNPTTAGTHNAVVSIINNDSNENPYNFNISGIAVNNNTPEHTIYYENFDVTNGGWVATNPGGNTVWAYGSNDVEPGTEGNYWYTDNYNNYVSNSNTYVTSPTIDLTGFNNIKLKLDIRYNTNGDSGEDDGMNVEYSDDNGATWQILGAYSPTPISNWYNENNVDALGGGADGWAGINTNGNGGGRSNFIEASIFVPASLHNNPQARIRLHFASDNGQNDDGVNFDNVIVSGDPIVPFSDPTSGPGAVTSNLRLWLKSNVGTNGVSDGNPIDTWSDQAFDNDGRVANSNAPVYYNNLTENINHNPVLQFDNINDSELKGKGGYFTDEYWIVMQSDGFINSSSAIEGVVSGRIEDKGFGEDGTGLWINPGSIRFSGEDNIVSHMIGSTPSNVTSASQNQYGRAYASNTDSYDNEVIILNVKYDAVSGQSAIFKNGIRIDNVTGHAFDQGSGTITEELNYTDVDNTTYALGVGRITIGGTPYDSHFNGKITEFFSYSEPNALNDQLKIQSYLALKNGITLHDINSVTEVRLGDENYIDSSENIIWNTVSNTGFNYDIAGIGRDDSAELNQKQSTSSNPGSIITMGLTDVYNSNLENVTTNSDTFSNQNFLIWGNDNRPFAAAPPISVDMSAGVPGLNTLVDFTSIERTWKVVETGSVAEVKVRIPEIALSATITPPGNYFMFISDTPTFDPTSEYRTMVLNGSDLETIYDFDGVKYITFGFAREYNFDRSITFDGVQDYLDADNNLDLTGPFTVSFWMKRDNTTTRTILSKSDVGYTEGYEARVLGDGRVNMRWRNASGINQALTSFSGIPSNEWHQVAFTFNGTQLSIYIDGVLDRTANRSAPVSSNRHFLIAAEDERTPSNFYEGTLDEVRVWDIALSIDQIRFIMNQEIEENTDLTVAGEIIPTTISKNEFSTTMWNSLQGYFPMNRYTFTNVRGESNNGLIAAIRNLDTVDFQTAPLPYISDTNGNWANTSTWVNGNTQDLPGALSVVDNTVTIDWNIIQTSHNITTNANNTVLSLEVLSNELSIENDSKMEVTHYLKLNGIMDLVDESQLVQTENSDLEITSTGYLEKDQQGTADTYSYNFWSAPVGTINTSINNQDYTVSDIMLDGTNSSSPNSLLFSGGLDGAATSPITISSAWLYKFTNDPAGDYTSWLYTGPSGSITPGEGYTMKGPGTGGVATPQNYTFRGKPNNSTDTDEITFNIGAGNQYLIGNPFPSALDANDFIQDNTHLDGTLYFWQHWGGGTHILAGYQGGYATYTLAGGVPAVSHPNVAQIGSGTKTPGRYIPVGQGFFAWADSTGTITINNSQRNFVKKDSGSSIFFFTDNSNTTVSSEKQSVQSNTQIDDTFYDAPDLRQKVRITFESPLLFSRELLLTVDNETTMNYDRMYDGLSFGGTEDDMKWVIEDDKQLVIQAIPEVQDLIELPLSVITSTAGVSYIKLSNIENENLSSEIYLKDNVQNSMINLKDEIFSIQLEAGEYNNRFSIIFKATNTDDTSDDNKPIDVDEEGDSTNNEDTTNTSNGNETNTSDNTSGTDTSDDNEEEAIEEEIINDNSILDIDNEDQSTSLTYNSENNLIQISKNLNIKINLVSLYSISGQSIQQWKPNSDTEYIELPVRKLSTGTYIAYLETETGFISKKIIIN